MRRIFNLLILTLISVLISNCSPTLLLTKKGQQLNQLQKQIQFLLDDPTLANAHVGIYVESLKDGKILFSQNPFKLMVPASNMKLFTTAAALVKLGPEWVFKTKVSYRGTIQDSVLEGDLIVSGSGDPTISGRFFKGNRLAVFKMWADSLKEKGIRQIKGKIIGDESYFSGPALGDGWNWDDEPYWYSAKISALALNDNCVDIAVWPDSVPGRPVHVQMFPASAQVQIVNKALTAQLSFDSMAEITRLHGTNKIVVQGNLALDADTLWESISVPEPGLFFVEQLKKTFEQNGIDVSAIQVIVASEKPAFQDSLKLLFTHQSPPLAEIIKVVNKPSHNFYAEQLLKTLGAIFKGEGSFERGAQVVHEFLNSIGVADEHFINVDGSGLSRKNFIAPMATATLLRYMYHHPYFNYFLESLPVAGLDGTLENRMRNTLAQGRVHAKTGYVQHMRALSGYTGLESKTPLLFVMMFNNYSVPTPKINLIQDKIAILLTRFSESH